MNKSVVGFIVGILIIAIGVAGWMIAQGLQEEAAQVERESTETAQQDAAPAEKIPELSVTQEPEDKGEMAPPPADPPPSADNTPDENTGTPAAVTITRIIGEDGKFSPGGTVDVTLKLDADNGGALRALGIEETYPPAFEFDSFVGPNRPDVPRVASPGSLEFAWITMPEFPYEFTYRLKVPAGATDAARFSGQALYRTDGDEMRSPVAESVASAGEPTATPAEDETQTADAKPAEEMTEETPAPAEAPAPEAPVADNATVTLERAIAAEGYTAGQPLQVSMTISYDGQTPVSALSVMETLPQGWTFGEWVSGPAPPVKPTAGRAGTLPFIWIQVPEFPAVIEYTVNVPDGEIGERQMSAEAVYRRTGGEEKSPPAVTMVSNL
jgi:hypothetical protein